MGYDISTEEDAAAVRSALQTPTVAEVSTLVNETARDGQFTPADGGATTIGEALDVALQDSAGSITKESWSKLSGVQGVYPGRSGFVLPVDAGTHPDPVVGGTVPNSGTYSWSVSPAGWQRVGAYPGPAEKANKLWVIGAGLTLPGGAGITLDLATTTGDYVNVGGTTSTIASLGTAPAGTVQEMRFSVVATLLHGTPISCPNNADLALAIGDIVQVRSAGSGNWRVTDHTPFDGRPSTVKELLKVGAPIAAAATVNLAAAVGDYVSITGSGATITSFGTPAAGKEFVLVLNGVNTIVHHGTLLVCPGGQNITTAANDVMRVRSNGTGLRVVAYESYDGRGWPLKTVYKLGANIAAAATVDLATATGDYIPVTGSGATITSFGVPTVGQEFTLTFAGANTITHNATSLICPNGQSLNVAANDVLRVRANGSGVRVVAFQPYAGASLADRQRIDDRGMQAFLRQRNIPATPVSGIVPDFSVAAPARMTITRAGTLQRVNALGVYETIEANAAPNAYDPLTGEYLGYRLELGSTNLLLRSGDLTNAYWTAIEATVNGSDTYSALGLTLQKTEETTANDLHGVSRGTMSATSGTAQVLSDLVRADEVTKVALMFDTGGFAAARLAKFDLEKGEVISKDTDINAAGLFEVAPGVWRIWAKATPTATVSTMRVALLHLDASGAHSYAGTSGNGVYAGAMQLEVAAQLTDYIPTTSATVTRFTNNIVTDAFATIPAGGFYVEFTPFLLALATRRVASVYGDASNRLHLTLVAVSATTMRLDFSMVINGTTRTILGPLVEVGTLYRVAVTWENGRQMMAINGGCYDLGTPVASTPVGAMRLAVGTEVAGGSSQASIYLKAALLFRRALTQAELSAMTSAVPMPDSVALLPIVGAVTDDSARFMADFAGPRGDVQVVISTSPKIAVPSSAPVFTTTAVATTSKAGPGAVAFHQVDITATGLASDTAYYARFKTGGRYSDCMEFRTAPADGVAKSQNLAFLSCWEMEGGDVHPAFLSIAKQKPDFTFHLGDWVYLNPNDNDLPRFRQSFVRRARSALNVSTMLRAGGIAMVPSNHDVTLSDTADIHTTYGTGATYSQVVAAGLASYKESFPHFPLLDADLFAQVITRGRVRIIMMDTTTQADHTAKTCLGATQMQAIKDELVAAGSDGMKLVLLASQNALNGGDLASWDMYYDNDLTELLDYIRDTSGVPACLFVVGNNHQNAASDGTELSALTTGGYGRIPFLMSSGVVSNGYYDVAVATWNGASGKLKPRDSQWAMLRIVDNGGSGLTWHCDFYSDPYDPITFAPTLQRSVSSADAPNLVQMIDATKTVATSGALEVDVEKTWFGPVDGCTVDWSAPGCTPDSGTVTFRPNQNKSTISTTAPASPGSLNVTLLSPIRASLGATTVCTVTVT